MSRRHRVGSKSAASRNSERLETAPSQKRHNVDRWEKRWLINCHWSTDCFNVCGEHVRSANAWFGSAEYSMVNTTKNCTAAYITVSLRLTQKRAWRFTIRSCSWICVNVIFSSEPRTKIIRAHIFVVFCFVHELHFVVLQVDDDNDASFCLFLLWFTSALISADKNE